MDCPTELMLAGFFTKALQGSLFKLFRDAVMGYVSISNIIYDDAKMKERVENKKNENKVISHNNNNVHKRERDQIDTEKNKNKDDGYTVSRSKKRKPVVKKIQMDESRKEKGKEVKRTDRTYVDEEETSNTKISWVDIVKKG